MQRNLHSTEHKWQQGTVATAGWFSQEVKALWQWSGGGAGEGWRGVERGDEGEKGWRGVECVTSAGAATQLWQGRLQAGWLAATAAVWPGWHRLHWSRPANGRVPGHGLPCRHLRMSAVTCGTFLYSFTGTNFHWSDEVPDPQLLHLRLEEVDDLPLSLFLDPIRPALTITIHIPAVLSNVAHRHFTEVKT